MGHASTPRARRRNSRLFCSGAQIKLPAIKELIQLGMECNITEGERRHEAARAGRDDGGRRCGILIIILGRGVPAKASQMRPAPV